MSTVHTNGPGLAACLAALDTTPVLVSGVRPAGEILPEVAQRRYLHSGPSIEMHEVPGPMRGALIGALLFEGEAVHEHEAAAIIDAGEIELLAPKSVRQTRSALACACPPAGLRDVDR